VPQYATKGAGCFDLQAILPDVPSGTVRVDPGATRIFRTGLAFNIPPEWCMEIYSRSGHGFKLDVRLANCVGIIDHDYTKEVMVKLTNEGTAPFYVNHHDRIAQAKLAPAPQWELVEVQDLDETERGGFGSTGT